MKHLFTMLLALVATTASAQTFKVDGIYYNILSEDDRTVMVISGADEYKGDIVIPEEVIYDSKVYLVTTIRDRAFRLCSALTSVSMPSVTTIGDEAFSGCLDLTSVSMQSVTTIGDRAFNYCHALKSVSMPSVTTIGDRVFNDCPALASVSMPSVTTIGDFAFSGCESLISVEMPSVTTIGEDAFQYCYSLASVSIPATCTLIGENPFRGCTALKDIVVDGNNPKYSALDGALYDKDKTALIGWPTAKGDISILPSVTRIGGETFYMCDALTSVYMPSVTTIGDWAFGCRALTSVSMPQVTTIGECVFYNLDSLTSVSMPAVITIGEYAFSGCSALTSIDIPASVTTIGDFAFGSCSSLTSVYCHWVEPLECDPDFEDEVLENAILYVPRETVDAYRSVKPWSDFANIVEARYSGIADTPGSEMTVKVIDGAIVIEGGNGTASAPVVEVYSAGGVCVYRGTDTVIGGLTHGVYVVKVGETVQKVAL